MPTSAGPNISGEENLVFGYDLSDTKNSYLGEPTTNKAGAVHLGFNGGRWGKVTNYPQKGNLPFDLKSDVYQLINGNNYWGSAGDFSPQYNKTYTLSYWYYLSSDSNISQWYNAFFGVPTGGGSSYTTVSTKTNDTFSTVGTNTWRYGSVNITTNTPVSSYTYFRGTYTSGSSDSLPNGKIYIANFQLEENTHATQYTSGTRSSVEGLIDVTGQVEIDLTNMSFDGNTQMRFDGTNDQIEILNHTPIIPGTSDFSIEMVVKSDTTARMWYVSGYNAGAGPGYYAIGSENGQFIYDMKNSNGQRQESTGFVAMNTGQTYHIMATRDINGLKIFINGQLQASNSSVGPFNMNETTIRFGSEYGIRQYLDGNIYMYKHYNRVLSTTEVVNNYNNIKSKYGI